MNVVQSLYSIANAVWSLIPVSLRTVTVTTNSDKTGYSVTGSVPSVAGSVGSVAGNIGGDLQGNVVGTVPGSVRRIQMVDADFSFAANVERSVTFPSSLFDVTKTVILSAHVGNLATGGAIDILRMRIISISSIGMTVSGGAPTTFRVTLWIKEVY